MAYSLKHGDASLTAFLRRVANYQLDAGIRALGAEGSDRGTAIHDARKRVKKLRALLRLLRFGLPVYDTENRALRDAGQLLSGLRENDVMVATAEGLAPSLDAVTSGRFVAAVRATSHEAMTEPESGDRIAAMRDALVAVRARTADWSVEDKGFDIIGRGVEKTYRRARRAMARTRGTQNAADLHEWRKRVKYHWYHARLLRRLRPQKMKPRRRDARELGEILGVHHDLTALAAGLPETGLSDIDRYSVEAAIGAEQERLADRADGIGNRLLSDRSAALVRRWRGWWEHWDPL